MKVMFYLQEITCHVADLEVAAVDLARAAVPPSEAALEAFRD